MIKRWNNQKKGLEDFNIKPTIISLFKQLRDVKLYKKQEKKLLNELKTYEDKLILMNIKREKND